MAAAIRSLRVRLLLAVGLVVVAAVAAVGYVSSRITSMEFHRFQELEESVEAGPEWPEGAAGRLAAFHARTGSWAGVERLLAELAREPGDGREVLLVDAGGRLAGASAEGLEGAEVLQEPGGVIRILRETGGGEEAGRLELILKTEGLPILEPSEGGPPVRAGTAYRIPGLPQDGEATAGDRFLVAVNRWLLGAVAGAGLLALAVTYFVSRRITAPVESLTRAARRMEHGDLTGRVKVTSDDEIGQLASAFNAMADGLERIESLRRRLVSDVAHELRTPLTGIRCQLESIQDGVARPDPATLAALHEDLLSLQRLVDDLQDLALAEAGRLALERRPVVLAGEVDALLRGLEPRRGGNGRPPAPALNVDLAGLPPADVDPHRFRQIMRNLLVNAMTHTPGEGAVEVTGRALGGEVEITVRDTGPGIAPEHLPHVFDRFYRADASRQRGTGGAGLGLAIVKQLVEAHGGRVRAESTPGEGSAFILTLPAARA